MNTAEKITVELTKEEVICLIKGIWPPYSLFNELDKLGFGRFIGGFVDKWEWNDNPKFWNKFSIEQLFDIYTNIKSSK